MYRALCLLVCMLAPLFGESIGTLPSTGYPPRVAGSTLSQFIADLAALPPAPDAPAGFLISPPTWQEPEASLNGLVAGPVADYIPTVDHDVYWAGSDTANSSAGSSVALTICLIMTAAFLRDYFLERTHCLEREQLREHLALANRKLENAQARCLMDAYATASATGDLALPERTMRLIETQFQTCEMARRRQAEAGKMLQEHQILLRRDLLTEARQPAGELVRRRQEIDLIETAIAVNRASGAYQRESEDLREHRVLAHRQLETARAAWLQMAFSHAAQTDPQVAACQEEVTLLRSRMEDHCRVHGCRERHLPVQSLAGAGLTV